MPRPKMTRLVVSLPPRVVEALNYEAERLEMSMSEVIRHYVMVGIDPGGPSAPPSAKPSTTVVHKTAQSVVDEIFAPAQPSVPPHTDEAEEAYRARMTAAEKRLLKRDL